MGEDGGEEMLLLYLFFGRGRHHHLFGDGPADRVFILKMRFGENFSLIAPRRLPLLLSGYLVNFRITKKISLSSTSATSSTPFTATGAALHP